MENDDNQFVHTETVLLPKVIESHGVVYEDPFKKIERITAEFEGFSKEYFVSDHGEKAAVLVMRDAKILMARQYRLLINGLSYEIPAGKVEQGEEPEAAAARECFEETGVRCENLRHLITYNLDLEYSRNRTYVYFTDQVDASVGKYSNSHVWLSLESCMQMVLEGTITDSLSLITLLAYKARNSLSYG